MANEHITPSIIDKYLQGASVLDLMAPATSYETAVPANTDIDFFRSIIITSVGDLQISGVDGVSVTIPAAAISTGTKPWGGIRIGAATTAGVILVR